MLDVRGEEVKHSSPPQVQLWWARQTDNEMQGEEHFDQGFQQEPAPLSYREPTVGLGFVAK